MSYWDYKTLLGKVIPLKMFLYANWEMGAQHGKDFPASPCSHFWNHLFHAPNMSPWLIGKYRLLEVFSEAWHRGAP